MSPIGLGNDIGGSLRNPASACGIASIRPTAGRVPDATLVPNGDRLLVTQVMAVQGPMARRVSDVRLGLKAIMGAHPRDPWSIDAPFEGPGLGGAIRVAVVQEPPGGRTDPAIAAVARRAADALADAGYDVVEAVPPRYAEAVEVWGSFIMTDLNAILPAVMPMMGAGGVRFLEGALEIFPPIKDALAYSHLLIRRDAIAQAWSHFLDEHPLVLTPTWSQLPFEHGFDIAEPDGVAKTLELMRPVTHANLMGLPSACVPAGRDEATGLPIGVLVNGRRLREDQCLAAAEAIEARLGLPTPIDPA